MKSSLPRAVATKIFRTFLSPCRLSRAINCKSWRSLGRRNFQARSRPDAGQCGCQHIVMLRGVTWQPGSGTPATPIYFNEIAFDPGKPSCRCSTSARSKCCAGRRARRAVRRRFRAPSRSPPASLTSTNSAAMSRAYMARRSQGFSGRGQCADHQGRSGDPPCRQHRRQRRQPRRKRQQHHQTQH